MEGRHVRLLGALAIMLLLSMATGCYIFVAFHYGHVWSLLFISLFLVFSFLVPAACLGYDDPNQVNLPQGLSYESYLNRRDVGYAMALVCYAITFVIPTAAWWRSDGLSPSMGAVLVAYVGNTCCGIAFEVGAKLYIWP